MFANKSSQDYLWSFIAIGIVGAAGLMTNLEIAFLFSTEALGLFGLAISVYVIGSQVWVLGSQNSCLHYVSLAEPKHHGSIVAGALLMIGQNTLVGLVLLVPIWILSDALEHSNRFYAVWFAIASLPFGACLKVVLFSFNGMQHIRTFYALQITRVVLVATWILFVWLLSWPVVYITACFIAAETAVLLLALWLIREQLKQAESGPTKQWKAKHYRFGLRSSTAGLSAETHTRVDLIVLSFFVSDTALGIYTFISLIGDGLFQFISVIRNNINPKLAQLYAKQNAEGLSSLVKTSRKLAILGYGAIAGATIFLYPYIINLTGLDPALLEGHWLLVILLGGTFLSCWLLPFDQALAQFAKPGVGAIVLAGGAATNLILNLALVPTLSLSGAAIATSLSWILLSCYLVFACNKYAGFSLISGRLAQAEVIRAN